MIEEEIIEECKTLLNDNLYHEFKQAVISALDTEYPRDVNWSFIFQKVYIHACLKHRVDSANWLKQNIYPLLPPVEQIYVKSVFAYGEHLLRAKSYR